MQHVAVSHLHDVPETMLWALYNRAVEARRSDTFLPDPHAVRIADAIAYDYKRSFGKPEAGQVARALLTDRLLRAWLAIHPDGQVVALGEGLETQFHRVDNGLVNWLAVDLPDVIKIRSLFLPDTERHRNLACSALDFRWLDAVTRKDAVFVTAVGLLKYFRPHDVRRLIATIAEHIPTAELTFDVMPHLLVRLSQQGRYRKGANYSVPAMYWGLNRNELHTIQTWHPNLSEVHEIPFRGERGFLYRSLLPLLQRTPWIGNHLFSLVHVRCKDAKNQDIRV